MSRSLLVLLSMGLFFVGGIAAAETEAAMGKMIVVAEQTRLTVTAIDQVKRKVTLKNEAGEEETFVIGKEARNLDQVEPGDMVTITRAEGLAVNLFPVTTIVKSRVERTGVARSDLGQKPHVSITRQIDVTGRISALDKQKRLVTLEGKNGSLTIPVAEDVDLDKVNKGDMVTAEYVEMLSITVDSPKK